MTSGTTASGVTVAASGDLILLSGASSAGITLAPGANLEIENVTVSGYTVLSGNTLEVLSGKAIGTTVNSGGSAFIEGGVANGGTIHGGTLDLAGRAAANGVFTFAGGGTLEISDFGNLNILSAAVISGFAAGDIIEVVPSASTQGPPNGVTLLSGNVLQGAVNGFLFNLYPIRVKISPVRISR